MIRKPIDYKKRYKDNVANCAFQLWYLNASATEQKLYDYFYDYSEKYFDDFRFVQNSIIEKYMRAEMMNDGEWVDVYVDSPEILEYFDTFVLEAYQYKAETDSNDWIGAVDYSEFTVTISSECVNENGKSVILHELIHLYESAFDMLPNFYRDILFLSLYNELKKKIIDLDDRILSHTHIVYGEGITQNGGEHDVLFLLKSFDLDLRCGYKLGTVCGYGRDEY